jgi:hypothetical protein
LLPLLALPLEDEAVKRTAEEEGDPSVEAEVSVEPIRASIREARSLRCEVRGCMVRGKRVYGAMRGKRVYGASGERCYSSCD